MCGVGPMQCSTRFFEGGRPLILIGIDIGGTKTAVLAADAQGNIRRKIRFDTETHKGAAYTLERIEAAVEELLAGEPRSAPIFGISCGGPLDSRAGLILSPPNLPGWDRIPITQRLTSRFGGQAYLMNDANACALAEWQFGAAKGCRNAVFLTFGTGMGGGLILDGRLYAGTNDLAGEVGHMRLAEDGPVGYGKRGSFEGFCSGGGIARLARQKVQEAWERGEAVSFCASKGALASLSAKEVAEAARRGDALALKVMTTAATYLGRGLAILIDVLNPEIIVIGSIYARCEDLMAPVVRQVVEDEALPGAAGVCRIVPAGLGEGIGDYGAIAVARYGQGM